MLQNLMLFVTGGCGPSQSDIIFVTDESGSVGAPPSSEIQRGTDSSTLAVQSTRVRPASNRTEPAAASVNRRVMRTGRRWSG